MVNRQIEIEHSNVAAHLKGNPISASDEIELKKA
jgi:hypothetical protein